MATVYLAHDLKHDRKVAIKVLKPELAAVLGAERFVVEIKTTAALQHPHILPLFDSGTAEGQLFYVMPYIQGETIREKLNRETQFGVDEAVRIAREIADALDYAHRHGVIHRDIKPENILLHDGRAMVMDFGIALAVSAAAGGRMTETGLSLGTPHYMSPEQATAEKEITGRSDVYSLATVLYEMLTGNPPFTGAAAQQIIMKIITESAEPVTKYRKSVPANIAAALDKALEKLPADRFENAKAFADALANPGFESGTRSLQSHAHSLDTRAWLRDTRSRVTLGGALSLGALLVVAVASRRLGSAALTADHPPIAARLNFAAGDHIAGAVSDRTNADRPSRTALAISPDGRSLVFVGERAGVRQLFVRPLSGESATPMPGTEGAESPFFSPDGQSVGFWSGGRLMRAPLAGGQPSQIGAIGRIDGASWSEDNRIVVGVDEVGLVVLSALGATPPDTIAGKRMTLPQFLPGGTAVLFSERSPTNGATQFRTDVITLKNRARKRLVENATDARFVPTGHLVFARLGTLVAVPFDLAHLEISGAPVVVLDDVMQALNGYTKNVLTGAMQAAISAAGDLVYVAGGLTPDRPRPLAWFDRQGRVTPIPGAGSRPFFAMRISPDERSVVATTMGRVGGVHVLDLARGTLLTLPESTFQLWPIWTPDGKRVVHRGMVRDSASLVWSLADGSRPAAAIAGDKGISGFPMFWSIDRSTLYALSEVGDTLRAINVSDGTATPVANLALGTSYATLSPDGKWLAYGAHEGRGSPQEVFVQPWPALDRKWKISRAGGFAPAWTRNGSELVYLEATPRDTSGETPFRMMSVQLGRGAMPEPQPPRELFTAVFGSADPVRSFDVTKDGSRFLVALGAVPHAPAAEPRVIANWFGVLRRLSVRKK